MIKRSLGALLAIASLQSYGHAAEQDSISIATLERITSPEKITPAERTAILERVTSSEIPDLEETITTAQGIYLEDYPDLAAQARRAPVFLLTGPRIFRRYHDFIFPNLQQIDTVGSIERDYTRILPAYLQPATDLSRYSEPEWLGQAITDYMFQKKVIYDLMVAHPDFMEFTEWTLPLPPELPAVDHSWHGYISNHRIEGLGPTQALTVDIQTKPTNWLHTFNFLAQLSQAYVSGNWYQGGTSHLSFLGGFLWDVQLNPVYHPTKMFQSTVSYKLSANSTPDDEYHKYNISQDQFQYNLKTGFKAYNHWFYSLLVQFKTQFFNSYPANSPDRSASFLSPGELNVGLGMTYTKENAAKTLKFSASVSPISYNLKTCLDSKVDHQQFGVSPDRRWLNELGSNAEVTFWAKIWGNTTYSTRLFLFSDYSNFQADWENTLNFQFSSVFSTQIYAHLRYDTGTDSSVARHWGKLMMKEILSVGVSYTFSTKG